MPRLRRPTGLRLRPETHEILDWLIEDTGLTRTGVIELAVRDLAKQRRRPDRATEPSSDEPILPPAQRRSARGLAAGIPGGSEEFMRRKQEEKRLEDRRGPSAP